MLTLFTTHRLPFHYILQLSTLLPKVQLYSRIGNSFFYSGHNLFAYFRGLVVSLLPFVKSESEINLLWPCILFFAVNINT